MTSMAIEPREALVFDEHDRDDFDQRTYDEDRPKLSDKEYEIEYGDLVRALIAIDAARSTLQASLRGRRTRRVSRVRRYLDQASALLDVDGFENYEEN